MKAIKLEKTVLFREVRNLLVAAYYLGQDAGLKGKMFGHPDCRQERKNIVEILMSEELESQK